MIFETHKPAHPSISIDKNTSSTENAEQIKGLSVFKCLCLTVSLYCKSKRLFCYISVSDGIYIRLQYDLKETYLRISNIIDIKEIGKGHTSESPVNNVLFFFRTLDLYSRVSLNVLHLYRLASHIYADASVLLVQMDLMQSN